MLPFEILQRKLGGIFCVIRRTAEYIQIDGATGFRKMGGYERSLDQLSHTEAVDARIFPEVHDLRLAVAFHFDAIT